MNINNLLNNYYMMNRINTLNTDINKNVSKLSTGKRVEKASDSPSEVFKISKLTTQIRGSQVAQRNVQEGGSFLQIKEVATNSMDNMAKRLKELSIQYKNDMLGDDDKTSIEEESLSILKEMQKVKETTKFNGKNVFTNEKIEIQASLNSYDIIDINTGDLKLPEINSKDKAEVIKDVIKELNKDNIKDFINSNNISEHDKITQTDTMDVVKDVVKELNKDNLSDFINSNNVSGSEITHNGKTEVIKDVIKELNKDNIKDFINSNNVSSSEVTHNGKTEVINIVTKELNGDNIDDFVNGYDISDCQITHNGNTEVIKDVTKELNSNNIKDFVNSNNVSSAQITHNGTTEIIKNITKELNSSNINEFLKTNNIQSSQITQSNPDVQNFDFSFSTKLCTLIGYDVNFHFERKQGSDNEYTVNGNTAFSRAEGIAKYDKDTKTFTIDYRYGCMLENTDRYTFNNINELSDLRNSSKFTAMNGQDRPIVRVVNYNESREPQNISAGDFTNDIVNPTKNNSYNIQCPNGKNINVNIQNGRAYYQTQEKEIIPTITNINTDQLINEISKPTKDDVINIKYTNGKNITINIKDGKAYYQTKEKELVPAITNINTDELINEIKNPTKDDVINIVNKKGQGMTITIKEGKVTYKTQEKEIVEKEMKLSTEDLIKEMSNLSRDNSAIIFPDDQEAISPIKNDVINIKNPNGQNITINIKDGKATYETKEKQTVEAICTINIDDLIGAIKNPTKDDIINVKKPNGENITIEVKDGKSYCKKKEKELIERVKDITVDDFVNAINNPISNSSINIKNENGKNLTVNIKDDKAYYKTQEKGTSEPEFDIKQVLSDDYIEKNLLKPLSKIKSNIGIKMNELDRKMNLEQEIEMVNTLALSNIEDLDIAKELMKKTKNEMLLNANLSLFSQNLENSKSYIYQLLK